MKSIFLILLISLFFSCQKNVSFIHDTHENDIVYISSMSNMDLPIANLYLRNDATFMVRELICSHVIIANEPSHCFGTAIKGKYSIKDNLLQLEPKWIER